MNSNQLDKLLKLALRFPLLAGACWAFFSDKTEVGIILIILTVVIEKVDHNKFLEENDANTQG